MLLKSLLDLVQIFVFLVGSLVSFHVVLLPEGMLFPSDLFVGILDVIINNVRILIFKLKAFHGEKSNLFLLKLFQFVPNVGVNEVSNVFAIVDLRYSIVLPILRDDIVFLQRNVEHSGTSILFFKFSDVGSFDLHGPVDSHGRSLDVVSLLRLSNVNTVDVIFLRFDFIFFRDGLLECHHSLTSFDLCLFNIDLIECADLKSRQVVFSNPLLNGFFLFLG